MTHYGGIGGVMDGRDRDRGDEFENAVERALGEKLRAEGVCAHEGWFECEHLGGRLYGSLGNVGWKHESGDTASYSFRAAGDLISAIIGEGSYMDWYCSHSEGTVDPEVREALAKEGWMPLEENRSVEDPKDAG